MSGRHSAPKEQRPRRPLFITLGVLAVLVLAGGGTAWALGAGPFPGGEERTAAAKSSKTPAPVPSAVLDCKEAVKSGEAAAAKALQSYKDWHAHVKAQLDLDKGKISVDKAWKIWDRTHARGSSNMNAFDAQRIVYERQEGACAELPDSVPATYDKPLKACKKRAKAISKTMKAGVEVGNEWMNHVLLERDKENISSYNYHQMWVKAVRKAPKALNAFESAHKAYKKSPACKLSQSA